MAMRLKADTQQSPPLTAEAFYDQMGPQTAPLLIPQRPQNWAAIIGFAVWWIGTVALWGIFPHLTGHAMKWTGRVWLTWAIAGSVTFLVAFLALAALGSQQQPKLKKAKK